MRISSPSKTYLGPAKFKMNLVWKGLRSQAFKRMQLFCNCFWEYVGPHSENLLLNICVSAKFLARAETFSYFSKAEYRKGGKSCSSRFPQHSYQHSEHMLHKESRSKTQTWVFNVCSVRRKILLNQWIQE